MTDRNVQYPYRFHVRPVPGTDDICEIIPAPGAVYEDGTFWNKQNVLKDATAALYGKTSEAVPDDIFAAIKPLIQAAQNKGANVEKGSYVGSGSNEKTVYFGFNWELFILFFESSSIMILEMYTRQTGWGFYLQSNTTAHTKRAIKVSDRSITTNRDSTGLTFYYTAIG